MSQRRARRARLAFVKVFVAATTLSVLSTLLFTSEAVAQPSLGPEISYTGSCLAGNGRIDVHIVNTGEQTATYRVEIDGLSPRQLAVDARDWWQMSVTGRPDRSYAVAAYRDAVAVANTTIEVQCDTDPPVVTTPPTTSPDEVRVVSACRDGNGYIRFVFANPTSVTRPYIIRFDGVPNRSTSVSPYGQGVRSVTGRPDGTYGAVIESANRIVARVEVDVACDTTNTPAIDLEPPTTPDNFIVRSDQLTTTSAGVRWEQSTDDVGVIGYELSIGAAVLAEVDASQTGYIFNALMPDTSYSFGVRAIDAAGNASPIAYAGAKTLAPIDTGEGQMNTQIVTDRDLAFDELDTAFNGFRVYLSSPRHNDSGQRGECGWEENINGRHLNAHAANGVYFMGVETTPGEYGHEYRNLRRRGYKSVVGGNSESGGLARNIQRSDNWGADLHLVSHSNAIGGCPNGGNYTLAMWREGDEASGRALAERFAANMDETVPGTRNSGTDRTFSGISLGELRSPDAPYRVFAEVFFHDNPDHVNNWMQAGGGDGLGAREGSWRYGWSIDGFLGYPEGMTSELSTIPGFGATPSDAYRDHTIALWEAYRRERLVSQCMATQGFAYEPDVAFPSGTAISIADQFSNQRWLVDTPSAESNRATPRTATADSLTRAARDRYDSALWGQSTEQLSYFDRTGAVPETPADDFLQHGCYADAYSEIPGIWTLRRKVLPILVDSIRSETDDPSSELRRRMSGCLSEAGASSTTMDELERELSTEDDALQAERLERCVRVWKDGISSVERAAQADVQSRFGTEFSSQSNQYADAERSIRADAAFVTYLLQTTDAAKAAHVRSAS